VASDPFVEISLLPHGRHPGLIALAPDKVTLVIPCQDSDNVCLVDLGERRVTKTIPLPAGSIPWQAAVTPDGAIACVTNSQFAETDEDSPRTSSTLSIIDLRAGTVIAHVPVGMGPNGVALDSAGRRAYVANMRSNDVSVVDLAQRREVHRIRVGQSPFSVALTPDDSRLLVTNFGDASLSVIELSTRRALHVVHTGVAGVDVPNPEWGPGDTVGVFAADNRIAYVTNWRSGSVKSVDLATGEILAELAPVPLPFGLGMTSDGHILLVASITDFTVIAVATAHLEKRDTLSRSTPVRTAELPSADLWVTDPDRHRVLGYLAPQQGARAELDSVHATAAHPPVEVIPMTTL
jgi:YVTN family beta-propeller protein